MPSHFRACRYLLVALLQRLEPAVTVRPELWRQDPPEVLSVDVAGYLHTERGAAPAAWASK